MKIRKILAALIAVACGLAIAKDSLYKKREKTRRMAAKDHRPTD
jgi:hypothetical protein